MSATVEKCKGLAIVRHSRRIALSLLLLSGMSACADKPALASKFCQDEGREIPEVERKARHLWVLHKSGQLPDYMESKINNILDDDEAKLALQDFVSQYPLCCQYVQSDYFGDRAYIDQSNNGEPFSEDQLRYSVSKGYMGDFAIFPKFLGNGNFEKIPFYITKSFRLKVILGQAQNCGGFSIYSRG